MQEPKAALPGARREQLGEKTFAAMQASMDGMAILDSSGTYEYMNEAHAHIYGYRSSDELLGRTWKMLYSPSERERIERDIMPAFFREGGWRGEARGLRKNGTEFEQEISLTLCDGDRFYCVVRDISDSKRVERTLKLTNEVMEAAASASSVTEICHACLLKICESQKWQLGLGWIPDATDSTLSLEVSTEPETSSRFEHVLKMSHELHFGRGEGLPGQAWLRGEVIWTGMLDATAMLPRRPLAWQVGLTSALALPIVCDGRTLAVFEFFSMTPQRPDAKLLATLARLGQLIGTSCERELAKERNRQAALLLQATLDATHDGILVVDQHQNTAVVNRRMIELWNAPESLRQERDSSKLINFASAQVKEPDIFLGGIDLARSRPTEPHHDRFELRDGRVIDRHSIPLLSGRILTGRLWILTDITEQSHADHERAEHLAREQWLRAKAESAEAQAKLLAQASEALDATLDLEGTARTAARLAIPRLADWCAIDLLEGGDSFKRLAVSHVDPAKEALRTKLEREYHAKDRATRGPLRVMLTGRPELAESVTENVPSAFIQPGDFLQNLHDLGINSYMCVPLKARGRILGAITFGYASAEKRYTALDLSLAEDFSRRAALAIDNARLYNDAQTAIQARHDFISTASHELKTPLTSLLGYIQLAVRSLRKCDEQDPVRKSMEDLLVGAEQQCIRMVRFIGELLDVSQITARGVRLVRENCDLTAITREAIEKVRLAYGLAESHINLIASGAVDGLWDRQRLEQVVINLVTNAVKYGAGKSVNVTVETTGTMARLAVRDQGIGISTEDMSQIWGRFERVVSAHKYQAGTGLGLWITRQIVESHGGHISVSSVVGSGSTFVVEIPRFPH